MPISNIPIKEIENSHQGKKGNGTSKTLEFTMESPIYTFEDMVIPGDLRDSIEDAISVFKYREKLFGEWNLGKVIKRPINICINFYGEPGTGKTMAAHAIADELNLKILKVNYADIESKYVGETSKNLVRLFNYAEENECLVLFDEADALLSKRVTDMNSATDVSVNQTRSVLLTILDKYQGILIFTTNFISNYDPAFMRRISNHIKFELPNEELRVLLLEHYLSDTVPNVIDIDAVAKDYAGITGGDITNALLKVSVRAARMGKDSIDEIEFRRALDNILCAKNDNQTKVFITERVVSEEYALKQINGGKS